MPYTAEQKREQYQERKAERMPRVYGRTPEEKRAENRRQNQERYRRQLIAEGKFETLAKWEAKISREAEAFAAEFLSKGQPTGGLSAYLRSPEARMEVRLLRPKYQLPEGWNPAAPTEKRAN